MEVITFELNATQMAFSEGMVYHTFAWLPVLFNTIKGIIDYPDKMPMPVWISVFGIFAFYSTFVIAQCTSVVARIDTIGGFQQDYRLFRYFALKDPQTLSYIATGMFTDLILGVLYSIPNIRKLFGLRADIGVAEPWALMAFFVLTAFLSDAASKLHPWVYQRLPNLPGPSTELLLYLLYAISVASLWGAWGVILRETGATEDDTATVWIIVFAVLMVLFVLRIVGAWGCLVGQAFGDCGVSRGRALLIVIVSRWTPAYWSVPTAPPAPLPPARRPGEQGVLLEASRLRNYHVAGMVLHSALVVFTLLVGLTTVDTYGSDWIGARAETYIFSGNWQQIDLAKNNETYRTSLRLLQGTSNTPDGTRRALDYCAIGTTVPIYYVACALAWSALSFLQHTYSSRCMGRIVQGVTNDALADFHSAVIAKWVEYSISATLMHVVVLRFAGILSFLQILILAGCLAASMVAGYRMELHMNMATVWAVHPSLQCQGFQERLPTNCMSHLQTECEFVLLSFYAKGILSMVLVATILFIGKSPFEVVPLGCDPPI